MRVRLLTILAALLAWASSPTAGATVTLAPGDPCTVSIDGPIEAGDLDALLQLRDRFVVDDGESSRRTVACLNSPGGDFYEGLRIARFFHDEGVGTRVGDGAGCHSVCAIMFMMGRAKGGEVIFANRTLHVGGALGFHRPYLTLDDAAAYTSGDINEAFDWGVGGILDLMRLASLPEPWGSGQMLPADLIEVMLSTPPEDMHLIATVEEALRWGIALEGDRPVTDPSPAQLVFACDAALTLGVRRTSTFYDRGLMTADVFALAPLPEFDVTTALAPQPPGGAGPGARVVGNLRYGYSMIGCQVAPTQRGARVCGIDESTDTRVGACERGEMRGWGALVYHHPLTDIATLGLPGSEEFDATRVARCVVHQEGAVTDNEVCVQAVDLHAEVDGGWARHMLLWPSGARTVIDIRAAAHDRPGIVVVNGEPGELHAAPDPGHCVRNHGSGRTVCVTAP